MSKKVVYKWQSSLVKQLESPQKLNTFIPIKRNILSHKIQHYSSKKQSIQVCLTSNPNTVASWINEQVNADQKVVGLDIEWQPSTQKYKISPVSLIQIATARSVLLVQLNFMGRIPVELHNLIASDSVAKVGVGIYDDLIKISKE